MANKSNLTKKELDTFYKNYNYIWKKLNVTHFTVKKHSYLKDDPRSNGVIGGELLPSYSICSKCKQNGYIPTESTIMKIIAFYNANIEPKITAWQFLHDDLSKTDKLRFKNSSLLDERFIGLFYGYYISSDNSAKTTGAVLSIFEHKGTLKAAMITGIRSSEELHSQFLMHVFNGEPNKIKFNKYYKTRTIDNQRCYYFEGNVEITSTSVLIVFHSPDVTDSKLILTLNISNFIPQRKRMYLGGLALMMTTNDSPFDSRVYQMGLVNSKCEPFHLEDERLTQLLQIQPNDKDFRLTSKSDSAWYELIISKAR